MMKPVSAALLVILFASSFAYKANVVKQGRRFILQRDRMMGGPGVSQSQSQSHASTNTYTRGMVRCRCASRQNGADSEFFTCVSLVGGTTVGAGILALPTFANNSGFFPSTLALLFAWLYMVTSGLLIAEVSTNIAMHRAAGRASERSPANDDEKDGLIAEAVEAEASTSLGIEKTSPPSNDNDNEQEGTGYLLCIKETLGESAEVVAGFLYLFLHYALLVAYTSEGGELVGTWLASVTPDQFGITEANVRNVAGPIVYSGVLGSLLFFGTEETIDSVNNVFCLILLVLFSTLLSVGIPNVSLGNLGAHQDYPGLISSVPIFLLSLVYHNIVPTVAAKLKNDKSLILQAILLGTSIPLLMFIAWDAVVLGMNSGGRLAPATAGSDPVLSMFSSVKVPSFLDFIGGTEGLIGSFSVFAITTSFIGFFFGLSEFWKDVLRQLPPSIRKLIGQQGRSRSRSSSGEREGEGEGEGKGKGKGKGTVTPLVFGLVLFPPLVVAATEPGLFLQALDYAGAFGIALLFGALPAIMAFRARQKFSASGNGGTYQSFVPGGNTVLISAFSLAIVVIIDKLADIIS